jgi:hypothetical protein
VAEVRRLQTLARGGPIVTVREEVRERAYVDGRGQVQRTLQPVEVRDERDVDPVERIRGAARRAGRRGAPGRGRGAAGRQVIAAAAVEAQRRIDRRTASHRAGVAAPAARAARCKPSGNGSGRSAKRSGARPSTRRRAVLRPSRVGGDDRGRRGSTDSCGHRGGLRPARVMSLLGSLIVDPRATAPRRCLGCGRRGGESRVPVDLTMRRSQG